MWFWYTIVSRARVSSHKVLNALFTVCYALNQYNDRCVCPPPPFGCPCVYINNTLKRFFCLARQWFVEPCALFLPYTLDHLITPTHTVSIPHAVSVQVPVCDHGFTPEDE